jgi:predicted tellurium resistance membrane protein TerC
MEWLANPDIWISLATLTILEIVLGIDNIIFISILAGKLPSDQQAKGRTVGLSLALVTRILLLLGITWVARADHPIFYVGLHGFSLTETANLHGVSIRDLILLGGGLFLIYKSVHEIHEKLEGADGENNIQGTVTFGKVIVQIIILDIVFSLDSVITAVGMASKVEVMIAAVILSMCVMLWGAGSIAAFVEKHPTIKMLALSFLLLIGVALVGEATHREIPKGYIYFAMAFSVGVEMLNLKLRGKKTAKPVSLHQPYR